MMGRTEHERINPHEGAGTPMVKCPRPHRSLSIGLSLCLLLTGACSDPDENPFANGDEQGDPSNPRKPVAMPDTPDAGPSDTRPEPDADVPDADVQPDDEDAEVDDTPDPKPPAECPDADNDGHRDLACGGDDCDDDAERVHPGAREVCGNTVDDDCDPTTTDDGDNDRDGYACGIDCDDADPRVNPGRSEVCNNKIDDDCDPATPDVFDADSDGAACDVDCNDRDNRVNAGASEVCANGVDDDCDPSTPDIFDGDSDDISCLLDCDDGDATMPDSSFYCGGRYSYYASFDTSDEGWVPSADSSWNRGAPRNGKFTGEPGRIGWFTQGEPDQAVAAYQAGEQSTLTSPSLDFSGLTRDPVLQFDRIRSFNNGGEVTLEISIDGGFVWTAAQLTPLDRDFSDASPTSAPVFRARSATPKWTRTRTLLVGTAGQADVRLRFAMSSGYAEPDAGIGIDNLTIQSHAYDAAIAAFAVPHDGCGDARDAGAVSLQVSNLSSQPVTDVQVSYQLMGGAVVTETLSGTLGVGATRVHQFSATADVSVVGTHPLQAWIALPDDQYTDNDLALGDTHTFPVLAPGDYFQDFEQDGGEWFPRGDKSTWARGIPIGDRLDGAASGMYAWVTNPLGAHNPQEQSTLTGPCWDFSDLSADPELLFALAYDLDDVNGRASAEVSTDGGATFRLLNGDPNAVNWYNDGSDLNWTDMYPSQTRRSETHTWRTARHTLLGTAGFGLVQMRFRLDIGGSTVGPGIGVDDVTVLTSTEDVALVSLSARPFRCSGDGDLPVMIDVRNDGNQPVSDVQVSYRIDGGAPVVETLAGPIAPGDTTSYTFTALLAAPAQGAHKLTAEATTAADFFSDNDSAELDLYAAETKGLPYQEDFEDDDGGWIGFGQNSTWEWGVPKTQQLRNPPNGARVWATNLTGDYAEQEVSYLLSPCFDMGGLGADPVLSLIMARNLNSNVRARVEWTTDGRSWNTVGASGEGRNWYNYSYDDSWSQTLEWYNATNQVAGAMGQGLVQFRLSLFDTNSSSGYVDEGIALDEFLLAEDYVDAQVTDANVPSVLCGASQVGVEVTNDGSAPLTDVPVSYVVDGNAPVNEIIAGPIDPGQSAIYIFSTPLDIAGGASATVQVLVDVPGDVRPGNDTWAGAATSAQAITGAGYSEDFEATDGGWQAGGDNGSWGWGAPGASNTYLSSAGSGSFAWFTAPNGPYNPYEESYLRSPCFDFSAEANDPLLSLDLIYDTDSYYDGAWLEASYDGGFTWNVVGAYGDPNEWYNVSGDEWWGGASGGDRSWVQASHALDGAAGTFATLRVRFSSNGSTQREGVGIDTIAIVAQ